MPEIAVRLIDGAVLSHADSARYHRFTGENAQTARLGVRVHPTARRAGLGTHSPAPVPR